jgi:hypothetical protein
LLPISLLAASQARAADVNNYAVLKNQFFVQTNANSSAPKPAGGFVFTALVDAATNNLTSATLELPSLVVVPFTNTPGVGRFSVVGTFSTQPDLDAAFPDGSYKFTLNTVHEGTKTPILNFSGNYYPAAPLITNYAEAQLIRPASNFVVRWAPFIGNVGVTNTILFTVRDAGGREVFSTPIFGQPGALNGGATSVTIPANTLQSGQSYLATLSFADIIAINLFQYPLVPGITAYATSTEVPLRTVSVPVMTITNTPGGLAELRFNSDPGRTYDLRASTNLTHWSTLLLTNAAGPVVIYTDTNSAPLPARFYRIQEP